MKQEILAVVIVVVIVGSLGVGFLAGGQMNVRTTTSTSTATSTQTLSTTVPTTVTSRITTTETSVYPTTIITTDYYLLNPKNESASSSLVNGTLLTLYLNATELGVSQKLQVSMSLRNTLTTSVSLQPTDNFRFYGLYVPFWGDALPTFLSRWSFSRVTTA